MLNSNIWATTATDNNNCNNKPHGDYDEKKTMDNNNDHKNNKSSRMVFAKIDQDFQKKELKKQQEKLKEEIIQLEQKFEEEFSQLEHKIKPFNLSLNDGISQNKLICTYDNKIDVMKENGIKLCKELIELQINFESNFYGKSEYDFKVYLTNVLIASHPINPTFQSKREHIFDRHKSEHGILCKYSAAPVETYERCCNKGEMDYNNREWPHTSHILDYIRCSVVFDDLPSFLNAYNLFWTQYWDYNNIDNQNGCIKCIVRVKNDFASLPEDIDSVYRDIKCNVLLGHNGIRIIGEI